LFIVLLYRITFDFAVKSIYVPGQSRLKSLENRM
jgi:hypothetical protein